MLERDEKSTSEHNVTSSFVDYFAQTSVRLVCSKFFAKSSLNAETQTRFSSSLLSLSLLPSLSFFLSLSLFLSLATFTDRPSIGGVI